MLAIEHSAFLNHRRNHSTSSGCGIDKSEEQHCEAIRGPILVLRHEEERRAQKYGGQQTFVFVKLPFLFKKLCSSIVPPPPPLEIALMLSSYSSPTILSRDLFASTLHSLLTFLLSLLSPSPTFILTFVIGEAGEEGGGGSREILLRRRLLISLFLLIELRHDRLILQ